jgi:hypothetical protein
MNRSRCMKWRYVFETVSNGWFGNRGTTVDVLWAFLRDEVAVLGMGCVERSWTRGRDGRGREEANVFLRALNEAFCMFKGGGNDVLKESWVKEMGKVRQAIEKW